MTTPTSTAAKNVKNLPATPIAVAARAERIRADRERELHRLAELAGKSMRGPVRDLRVAELLACLGVIADTPGGKQEWMSRG